MKKHFYVTSAIPYVNAKPHIGHALEFVQTDAIARYQASQGYDVKMLSGGDENALKNVQAAEAAGAQVQAFVDANTELFHKLTTILNCRYDVWQKGSDHEHHFPASQKLWDLCKHDIYQKTYKGLYCVGCEAFYTPDELNENGECFEHPGKKLEEIEENNYFFALSKYQKQISELISNDTIQIYPPHRKNEILEFVNQGLTDISVSRSNERARNWGVPVPDDDSQRMYVWFDALNIYQSGIGFGWDDKTYNTWWPANLHVIGKGILRFHAVYWPAFLLSANLKLPKAIFVHDYFTVNGQKMSKTLGNVIDPIGLVESYGADPLRYYFLAKFSPFNDGDFSEEKFKEAYNADLANGLGNLVARVAKMAELANIATPADGETPDMYPEVVEAMQNYRFDHALDFIWSRIREADTLISSHKLWENTNDKTNAFAEVVGIIRAVAANLVPFMPETAQKITEQFSVDNIKAGKPLFPRLQ